jgi:hypothetical protein
MTKNIFNSKDWPALPLQRVITKNSKYFRFKNKLSFIDVLNPYITSVYEEILNNCEDCTDVDIALDCAKKIVYDANSVLSNCFKKMHERDVNIELFFKIQVYKMRTSKKPILFGYHLNWDKFSKFIENFPASDKITLEDKYKYIFACKYSGVDLSTDTILQFRNSQKDLNIDSYKVFRQKFDKVVSNIIGSINNTLDGLVNFLAEKLNEGKNEKYSDTILDFIPDVISSIDGIKILASNGYISSCYREIRSLIERISYVILDEYLTINSLKLGKVKNEITLPLLNINSKWRSKQDKIEVRKISDLIPQNIFNGVKVKQRKKIENILLKKMSVEMYVALAGKPKEKDNDYAPSLKIDLINQGIREIEDVAKNSNDSSVTNAFTSLTKELNKKWKNSNDGEFPFPTTSFVFDFLKRVFDKNLKVLDSIWNNYSLFIHPYIFTWEVIPKTSVLEYKLFEYEITKNFESSIENLFNYLFAYFKTIKTN